LLTHEENLLNITLRLKILHVETSQKQFIVQGPFEVTNVAGTNRTLGKLDVIKTRKISQ
jgi:hypothetical protein